MRKVLPEGDEEGDVPIRQKGLMKMISQFARRDEEGDVAFCRKGMKMTSQLARRE
jgi:hypothetical protein